MTSTPARLDLDELVELHNYHCRCIRRKAASERDHHRQRAEYLAERISTASRSASEAPADRYLHAYTHDADGNLVPYRP